MLDLSKRNRILNYKKRKTGLLELEGEFKALFPEVLGVGICFDVLPPFPDVAMKMKNKNLEFLTDVEKEKLKDQQFENAKIKD